MSLPCGENGSACPCPHTIRRPGPARAGPGRVPSFRKGCRNCTSRSLVIFLAQALRFAADSRLFPFGSGPRLLQQDWAKRLEVHLRQGAGLSLFLRSVSLETVLLHRSGLTQVTSASHRYIPTTDPVALKCEWLYQQYKLNLP